MKWIIPVNYSLLKVKHTSNANLNILLECLKVKWLDRSSLLYKIKLNWKINWLVWKENNDYDLNGYLTLIKPITFTFNTF